MKCAVYGDAHITRKMNSLQDIWDISVTDIFKKLYEDFESHEVEIAVCLGDIFDKAILEAKSVKLVLEVLSIINNSTFPTFILLGNHEIYSPEHNILDYLNTYNNIIPVTKLEFIEGKFTFIPYSIDIEDVPEEYISGKYVFTHHDIYGSELAGGKVKASFGVDPNVFSGALKVFNGHVHLNSTFGNIINVGSITKMQQGELRVGETPKYYYLDTRSGKVVVNNLEDHFIAYLTVSPEMIPDILNQYHETVKFSLRVQYGEDIDRSTIDEFRQIPRILSLTLRKTLKESLEHTESQRSSTLDMKNFLVDYINKDESLSDLDRDLLIELGIALLEVGAPC